MNKPPAISSPCRVKFEKAPKNVIDFDRIVKFLNDQRAVMDYAGLN